MGFVRRWYSLRRLQLVSVLLGVAWSCKILLAITLGWMTVNNSGSHRVNGPEREFHISSFTTLRSTLMSVKYNKLPITAAAIFNSSKTYLDPFQLDSRSGRGQKSQESTSDQITQMSDQGDMTEKIDMDIYLQNGIEVRGRMHKVGISAFAVHKNLTLPSSRENIDVDDSNEEKSEAGGTDISHAYNYTQTWIEKRNELLAASGGVRKLYLFSYMRGGSTLLGQVFNQDPSTIYWYEPLNMFYGAYFGMPVYRDTYDIIYYNATHLRRTSKWEEDMLVSYFSSIFECRLQDLPVDAMASDFLSNSRSEIMASYVKCFKDGFKLESKATRGIKSEWGQLCPDLSGCGAFCGPRTSLDRPAPSDLRQCAMAQLNQCPEILHLADQWLETYTDTDLHVKTFLTMLRQKLNMFVPYPPKDRDRYVKKMESFKRNALCKVEKGKKVQTCLRNTNLEDLCSITSIRVVKALRLKFINFLPIVEGIADLSVIHYVRDPRAIAHSKVRMYGCRPKDKCLVSMTLKLCQEMTSDIWARQDLEQRYPGVFLQVRYEDLVLEPEVTVNKMFNHIGKTPHQRTLDWIKLALHFKRSNDSDPHGVLRTNGTDRVYAWRKAFSHTTLLKISRDPSCHNLFNKLGYSLL